MIFRIFTITTTTYSPTLSEVFHFGLPMPGFSNSIPASKPQAPQNPATAQNHNNPSPKTTIPHYFFTLEPIINKTNMKKNLIRLFIGAIMLLSTVNVMAQPAAPGQNQSGQAVSKGMIKVTVLYPNADGKKFDMDYYTNRHLPMVKALFADALKLTAIDKGVAGGAPGSKAPFVVVCHFYFDNISAFQNAMKVNGSKIQGDIPNYTDIQPVIQISEVVE